MGNIGMQELLLIGAVIFVFISIFTVVPYWFIFRKAGYNPLLSLLMAVPLVELIMKFFLAFAEWPSLKNVDH